MSTLHYDPRYLFWIWYALAFVCAIVVLAGVLGYQTWQDVRILNRAAGQQPRRRKTTSSWQLLQKVNLSGLFAKCATLRRNILKPGPTPI